MRRRAFITLLGGAAAWPLAARAQQAGMPVVGFLHAGTPSAFVSLVTAFREGLDTAGYVEGRSVAIEYRWAENHYERLPALLTDLVGRRVAVIAALGDGPAATAKAGTSAIPVVVMAASDPVGAGLVGSLNRPGGNITGISMFTSDLMAKRIELLTELVPKATTIGLLVNPTGRRAGADTNEAQAAARALGYEEGRTVIYEMRWAEGKPHRLPALARELAALDVDVIVTGGETAIQAAQNAAPTTSIVMGASNDPVGAGLAQSLARPGGMVTGLTIFSKELSQKRLELFREAVPSLARVAVLINPSFPPALACRMRPIMWSSIDVPPVSSTKF